VIQGTDAEQAHAFLLTPAQQLLTLTALEVLIGDMTERLVVQGAGEVCNLLRAALGMEPRAYWDDSD
jgi:hypothetical protein